MCRNGFISVVLLIVCHWIVAQQIHIDQGKLDRIDSLLSAKYPSGEPGIVALIAQDGQPLFSKAYGLANVELRVPMHTDHRLGIGSISKQFTAVAILMLQEEGLLRISDDFRTHLPDYNTHGRTITIAQLLSHTSGIPSYTEIYGFDTLYNSRASIDALVAFFENAPLLFEPGTDWSYSNSGYVLAALVVERLSGMPFNTFLRERIFIPLRMHETTTGTSDAILANKTGEYNNIPRGKLQLDGRYRWYWAFGAGQIMSTVTDMLKWDAALYSGALLRPETLEAAFEAYILAGGRSAHYGLGWGVQRLLGKTVAFHGGAIGGYRAGGYRMAEDKLYVIYLSNTGATNSIAVGNEILSILYNVPPFHPADDTTLTVAGLTGVYESLDAGTRIQRQFSDLPAYITIRHDTSGMTIQRSGGARRELHVVTTDTLVPSDAPFTYYAIARDTGGRVSGFYTHSRTPYYGPVRFNRKLSNDIHEYDTLPVQSEFVAQLTGTYYHEFGGRVVVTFDEEDLIIEYPQSGQRHTLDYAGGYAFVMSNLDQTISFTADADGTVSGFQLFTGTRMLNYTKVKIRYADYVE